MQRNVGANIGVQADLVELPREQVQEIGSEDELEVPDWSCADEEKTPSDVPSPPNEPEASGGVTLEAPVPQPSGGVTPAQQFRVCTFGVAKLCMAWRGRNTHANDLHAAWFPTKGGRPEPIDRHVINNALMYAWGVPDVITDARCFRPPPHDWTDMHMGYSLTMSQRLVEDVDAFQPMWQKAMKQIPESAGGVTPVNIAVFCRAGEKRSVSIAWMLSSFLQVHLGWKQVEPIDHLCRIFWERRTSAAGKDCKECDLTDQLHEDIIVKKLRYMAEE